MSKKKGHQCLVPSLHRRPTPTLTHRAAAGLPRPRWPTRWLLSLLLLLKLFIPFLPLESAFVAVAVPFPPRLLAEQGVATGKAAAVFRAHAVYARGLLAGAAVLTPRGAFFGRAAPDAGLQMETGIRAGARVPRDAVIMHKASLPHRLPGFARLLVRKMALDVIELNIETRERREAQLALELLLCVDKDEGGGGGCHGPFPFNPSTNRPNEQAGKQANLVNRKTLLASHPVWAKPTPSTQL